MASKRLRIIRVVPGARRTAPIVEKFVKGGDGILTAFSDSRLRAARAMLPYDSPVSAVPFGNLVSQFKRRCELQPVPLAQAGIVQAAVKEACAELDSESPFAASAGFPGLHRRVASALKTLRSWQFGMDDLRLTAPRLPERTSQRIQSLAEVGDAVASILDRLGRTENDAQIAECLAVEPPALEKSDRILVLAGSDFAPNDCDWLLWASAAGAAITVVTEGHAGDAALFAGARQIERRLGSNGESLAEEEPFAESLFGAGTAPDSAVGVTVQSVADPLAEAEWALRGCREDLEAGIPPQRVGIFARDMETYGPLLLASASRLGVTVRLSRRNPLPANGFARLALSALQFCASDDVRSLLPVGKSSYLALDRPSWNELASQIKEVCADRERQWQRLAFWATEHQDAGPWLAALLRWREEAQAKPAGLAEWTNRLKKMIEALGSLERVESAPQAVRQRDGWAQTAMIRSVAQLASVRRLGREEELNLRQFAHLCRTLWENEDTGVPPSDGGIPVFRSGDSIEDVDSLYVLGMLEGTFPRRRAEDPILNDADLQAISEAHPERPRLPDSHDAAHAERDEFYRVCMSAAEKLCFSYPLTEDDRDNVPAFYLAEVERALGGRVVKRHMPRGMLAPEPEHCLSEADKALAEALASPPVEAVLNELVTDEARDAVRPIPDQGFTPNQIRDVLECPFRYVARHRLKLPSPRSANRWGLLSRLPQSIGLWGFEDRFQAARALEQALDAEIESHYAEIGEWERTLLRSGGLRVIREWIGREFAAREKWPREPGSVKLNARFGTEPVADVLPTAGGGRIKLEGVLPAVSRIGDYSVAHVSQVRRPSQPRGGELQEDSDILQLGIPMMALFGRRGGVGVEVESMRGGRTLFTLYQGDDPPAIPGDTQAGLNVVRLGKPSEYMPAVKQMLADALRRFERAAIEAQPGDYCEWCDVGELCRRSRDFGEEDSPFSEEPENGD